MQEEEKQGADPAENNTRLYSRKLIVRTGKDFLAHTGESHRLRCVQNKRQWVLVPLGRAVAVVEVPIPTCGGQPPPAAGHALPWIRALL